MHHNNIIQKLTAIEMYHRLLKCQKKPSHTHTCCAACSVLCEDIVYYIYSRVSHSSYSETHGGIREENV